MKRIWYFALALALPLGALAGQETAALAAGARVRVIAPKPVCNYPEAAPCYRRVVGTVESLQDDTVVIAPDSAPAQAINLSDGQPLEMSLGMRGHGGTGALIGAIVGLVVVHQAWQSCGGCEGEVPIGGALLGIAGGASLGAITGSMFRSEVWVPVHAAGIRIVAGPGRAGFMLSF